MQDTGSKQASAADQDQQLEESSSTSQSSQSKHSLDYTQLNSKQRKRVASGNPLAAIWAVTAQPISFDADRTTAKALAKELVAL